jgi:hypothetical protein
MLGRRMLTSNLANGVRCSERDSHFRRLTKNLRTLGSPYVNDPSWRMPHAPVKMHEM